jgi:hypothetical protein
MQSVSTGTRVGEVTAELVTATNLDERALLALLEMRERRLAAYCAGHCLSHCLRHR